MNFNPFAIRRSVLAALAAPLFVPLAMTASAQIFEPEGVNMPGQWDGFSNPPRSRR